ncbi:hypothetical protein SDJN03_07365, partial [Cucurbita argyrosperma subsp. sororia]
MRFRVSPDHNRVIPDPHPTPHHPPSLNAHHLAPIDPPKSVLRLIPANPETAVMSTRPVIGNKAGDGKAKSVLPLIAETAVTSTGTLTDSHGYRVGIGKGKSVIPKRRKLVKTMMYHCIKNFLKSLFRRPPETHNRPKPITGYQ